MLDEINSALETYNQSWQKLIDDRANRQFFESLKPVAVGWKVADQAEYTQVIAELHDLADKIIETWMNGRWIAKLHLKDTKLTNGVELIKIMQRRPGSDDALGLDHVDFYSPEVASAEPLLKQEQGLNWTWESNDVIQGYDWISIWFEGTEAKLKSDTVLDIIQVELKELNTRLTT